jgi:hypothetical protein
MFDEALFSPVPENQATFAVSPKQWTRETAYGLTIDASRHAAVAAWHDTSRPMTISSPQQAIPPAISRGVSVNGAYFPVFKSTDFVNMLKGADAVSWRRVRESYEGGDNGGGSVYIPDTNGSLFQRYQMIHPGGDNGSWEEWVNKSPFGISKDAMQRHFRAGDRGDVMAGPKNTYTDNNFWPEFDPSGGLSGLTIKTSERNGTYVPYVKGSNNEFTPEPASSEIRRYYTNNGNFWRSVIKAVRWIVRIVDSSGNWTVTEPQ